MAGEGHQSGQSGRLTRRRLVGNVAAPGTGVLLLAACGGDSKESSKSTSGSAPATPAQNAGAVSTETAQRGGVFRITTTSPIGIQDPHFGPANGWVASYMGDPLVE